MNTRRLALGAVLLILVLIVLGAVILPPIVRPVIEGVAEEKGITLEIGGMRIGVLRGTVGMSDVRVPNLPGYADPQMGAFEDFAVNAKLIPLLRGELSVQSVVLDKPTVHAERLSGGRINVAELLSQLTEGGGTAAADQSPQDTGEPPPFRIRQIRVKKMELHWTDRDLPGPPATVALTDVDVTITDLYSPMPADRQDTRIEVSGRFGGDSKGRFRLMSTGNFLAQDLDFTGTLTFKNVAVGDFQPYYATIPIQPSGGTVSGTVDATCVKNELEAVAKLQFADLTLQSNAQSRFAARLPAQVMSAVGGLQPDRKMEIKVSGNIRDPKFHVSQAVIGAVATDIIQAGAGAAGIAVDATALVAGKAGEVGKTALETVGGAVGGLIDRLPFKR